jgi:glucosylceramidase
MSFEMNGKCLALNHGAIEHGTRLTMEECDSKALHQKWFFQKGQMFSSLSSTSKCVTAGYAFVQTVAFLTPENKKVLVVLNENSEDAHFFIKMENTHVETLIPKNGIRTFTWK